MAEFSLELNEDQLQIQKWVHDFAENVVRPAAHEWDEREETPWPIIEEAARDRPLLLRLRGQRASPTPPGYAVPVVTRRWPGATPASPWPSSARPWPSPASSPTAPPSSRASGSPSASARPTTSSWPPSASPSPTPARDVSSLKTRAVYDEATDEWVLNGTKTWITNGGIANIHVLVASVDPELGSRGQASFVVPEGTPGHQPGPEVQEDGHPGLAHRRGRPRGLPGARPLPARRQGEAGRAPGPGPGGQAHRRAGGHGHLRGHPPAGRRPGRRASPGPPTSTPSTTPRSASSSGGRSSRTRPSPSSSPT